jgi:hypothetical protein
LVAERLRVAGSCGVNPAGKIATIVAGMAAGADCIDDLDVVRSGGLRRLFGASMHHRRWGRSCGR